MTMERAPGVNSRFWQTAADFWLSKSTWLAIAGTITALYQAYMKQIDWNMAVAMIWAAWQIVFHRDATVKAERKGPARNVLPPPPPYTPQGGIRPPPIP